MAVPLEDVGLWARRIGAADWRGGVAVANGTVKEYAATDERQRPDGMLPVTSFWANLPMWSGRADRS